MTEQQPTAQSGIVDPLISESAHRLFGDVCGFDAVQQAETDRWSAPIWQAVADSGFAWIGIPEQVGGSGGTLADACEVLRIAGANAAPIPLAETGLLGGWLLGSAGLTIPDGPVSVVPITADQPLSAQATADGGVVLSGSVDRVPWATSAHRLVVLLPVDDGDVVVSIDPALVSVEAAENLAGEPRDTVSFAGVEIGADDVGEAPQGVNAESLRLRGALSRVMMMAGALEAMSELTIEYTTDRQQFGRPVGRFQAVQQHLVWGAQDAAITTMAAQVAARDASRDLMSAKFQIGAAKVVADEAASTATRWAHQAHGAMGMTQEYALHHYSRRLWAWRHEYSSPGQWASQVGDAAQTAGADRLYELIAT